MGDFGRTVAGENSVWLIFRGIGPESRRYPKSIVADDGAEPGRFAVAVKIGVDLDPKAHAAFPLLSAAW